VTVHYTATALGYPRCGAKLGRQNHRRPPVTQDVTQVTCAKCRKLIATTSMEAGEPQSPLRWARRCIPHQ